MAPRRNLDAIVTVAGDAVRDGMQPAFDLTRLSDAEEMRLGDAIDGEARTARQITASPELQAYLEEVVTRVAAGVDRTGITYRIRVLATTEVNAHAVAGGRLYITEGMLRFLESEAELAAILGHEIAHVDRRHCVRQIQIEQAAGRVVPGLGQLAQIGYALMEHGFSEEQEMEADVTGVLLAASASYDPWAAVAVFRRFAGEEPEVRGPTRDPVIEAARLIPEALGRYIATHPPADERIEAVDRALRANTGIWASRRLYVGRGHLMDRRASGDDPRAGEWIVRHSPP